MIYFISDTHFGHANTIYYDNRPFSSVGEMDEALINNWNEKVTPGDNVYILGDFSWYKPDRAEAILRQLNGAICLIRGNHDHYDLKGFSEIADYKEIKYNGTDIILSHYPILFWNKQHRGSIHLYGHVHSSTEWNAIERYKTEQEQLMDTRLHMYNVGCMMPWMNYAPQSIEEIIYKKQNWDVNRTVRLM